MSDISSHHSGEASNHDEGNIHGPPSGPGDDHSQAASPDHDEPKNGLHNIPNLTRATADSGYDTTSPVRADFPQTSLKTQNGNDHASSRNGKIRTSLAMRTRTLTIQQAMPAALLPETVPIKKHNTQHQLSTVKPLP